MCALYCSSNAMASALEMLGLGATLDSAADGARPSELNAFVIWSRTVDMITEADLRLAWARLQKASGAIRGNDNKDEQEREEKNFHRRSAPRPQRCHVSRTISSRANRNLRRSPGLPCDSAPVVYPAAEKSTYVILMAPVWTRCRSTPRLDPPPQALHHLAHPYRPVPVRVHL